MFDKKTVKREIGGRTFSLATGQVARQAGGAVLVQVAETVVLVCATDGGPREGLDFFPLTMDYREKTAAAGKIPGGFFKREGRPNNKEILTMRMMDRPIRPLFPDGFRSDIQVMASVLSADTENDSDILAINGASAALSISAIPFNGPVGAVRVGQVDGELVLNPTYPQREESDLDLVIVGTDNAVTMVECGARELTEERMLEAIAFGHEAVKEFCAMQNELRELAGKEKAAVTPPEKDEELYGKVFGEYEAAIRTAMETEGKFAKGAAIKAVRNGAIEVLVPDAAENPDAVKAVKKVFYDLEKHVIRQKALEGVRVDGRGPTDIRDIECEVSFLPRTHGSALFTRGETQALVQTTLGTTDDEQIIDGLQDEYRKNFLLHYNFPPYSVGETRRLFGPGRREIGHGALAERAIQPVLPEHESFPYTIRITSEITESNGSSSMATVCGGTLSLMDAGVKIRRPVAGIAMGLVMEDDRHQILSDILGAEDHSGDMDFKVAGTQNGITALQMDIKMTGVPEDVMAQALNQARDGRIYILRKMLQALNRPRAEISAHAPKMFSVQIPKDRIGMLIGPGGKNIRRMQEDYACSINVDDDGMVKIFSVNSEGAGKARDEVELLGKEAKMDEVYKGRVISTKDFGCFLELWPGTEALCHISELSDGYLDRVEDAVSIGDELEVKVIAIDDSGRVKVSRKAVLTGSSGGGDGDGGAPREKSSRGGGRDRGGRGDRNRGGDRRGGGRNDRRSGGR
ncbi:MAG: polyribonucleotide nucleotidyltransferase, partial [Planctomycetota bacterium]